MNLPMNWLPVIPLCGGFLVLFWFRFGGFGLVVVLFAFACSGCWWWRLVGLCTGPSPVHFCGLNSRWPQVLIWNYCFCNAIERVKRPGGSHEGVGRKKETDMIFGDGVGLPCSRPLLLTRCWFVWRWCVSTVGRHRLGPEHVQISTPETWPHPNTMRASGARALGGMFGNARATHAACPKNTGAKTLKCWDKKSCAGSAGAKKVYAGHASHTLAHCFQEMSACMIADI